MTEQKIWKWGIIGPGRIAEKFAKGLAVVEHAQLQAVGSSNPERAQKFADKHGAAKAYGSHQELFQDPDVDIVYIATLNPQHAEGIEEALEAGKHVLCEKPFTLNHAQAERLVALAKAKNLFLMEGMWTRTHPVTRQVMNWLEEERIGKLIRLEASLGFELETSADARVVALEKGGSALMDVGVYAVSYASMVFQKQPKEFSAYAKQVENNVDLSNSLLFNYGDGQTAQLSISVENRYANQAIITGTKGIILVDFFWHPTKAYLFGLPEREGDNSPWEEFAYEDRVNGFEFEIEEVQKCLDEGRTESPLMPLAETVAVMNTLDQIRSSWSLIYPAE